MEMALLKKAGEQLIKSNSSESLTKIEPLEKKYFKLSMIRVAAEKRDSVPDEVLNFWWDTISRLNWTKEKFDAQAEKIKRAKIYGAIKIEDIINPQLDENVYSQADVQREVKSAVDILVTKGENILRDKEVRMTVKVPELDRNAVILAIIKRLKHYHNVEAQNIALS